MTISARTQAVIDDIKTFRDGQIFPYMFQRSHARANVSAAFRCALKQGIIRVADTDGYGQKMYKLTDAYRASTPTSTDNIH